MDLAHLVPQSALSMNTLGLLCCVQLLSRVLLKQHPADPAPALSSLSSVLTAGCRYFLGEKELVQHSTLRDTAVTKRLDTHDSSSRTLFDSVSLLLELGVGGDLRAVELLEHVEHALKTAEV